MLNCLLVLLLRSPYSSNPVVTLYLAQHLSTSNLRHLIIYNLVTCVPFRQVIFKWGQVETEIYLPCGQEDFNFFSLPCKVGDSAGCLAINPSNKKTKQKKITDFTMKLHQQLIYELLFISYLIYLRLYSL